MKKEVKLSGFIHIDEFGLCLSGYGRLSNALESEIFKVVKNNIENSRYEEKDEDCTSISMFLPKVSLSLFFSDKECSLEESQKNVILMSLGGLDLYEEWWGYSEFTVMGYDILNFKLVSKDGGEHDLDKIIRSYRGKYVHIVLEILDDEI
jgi:hypothetical protein